ncbi:Zn(2)-C6 fungal-specific transcription factor [Phycomyces blakesleeanus]
MHFNHSIPCHDSLCVDTTVTQEIKQLEKTPIAMVSVPSIRSRTPRSKISKRKQVKNACVNCQKACKKCDEGRPCKRCVKLGLTETCINSPRKERRKGVKRGPYKKRRHHQAVVIRPTNERQSQEVVPPILTSPAALSVTKESPLSYLTIPSTLMSQQPWQPAYASQTIEPVFGIDNQAFYIDQSVKPEPEEFYADSHFFATSSTPPLSQSPLSASDPLDLYGLGNFFSAAAVTATVAAEAGTEATEAGLPSSSSFSSAASYSSSYSSSSLSPLSITPTSQTFPNQPFYPTEDLFVATPVVPSSIPPLVENNTTSGSYGAMLSHGNSFYQPTDTSLLFPPTSPTDGSFSVSMASNPNALPSWSSSASAYVPNLSQPIYQTQTMLIQKPFTPWLDLSQTFQEPASSWQSFMTTSFI